VVAAWTLQDVEVARERVRAAADLPGVEVEEAAALLEQAWRMTASLTAVAELYRSRSHGETSPAS
jgi:hypothetical protein